MFRELDHIVSRPEVFSRYTADTLWTDEHISQKMLTFHLDGAVDLASRKTEFIERSVAWMKERFDLGPGSSAIDFGCGPGLYTSRLAALGAEVTGVAFSSHSLEYARQQAMKKGLPVDYQHADYLQFEAGRRFDLATMIMYDFCALSPDQRGAMLDRFRRHLGPGGALLLDVCSNTAFAAREETSQFGPNLMSGFWAAEPYFGFMNTFKYDRERVTLDKYTIVQEKRTFGVYNWLQFFDPEFLTREVEAHGLKVVDLLGDVAGSPYNSESHEFAIVATAR